MWLCLNDAFLSIVHKDCKPGELLVRARRHGDIERVFGRRVRVTRATDADYLYRAVVPRHEVEEAMLKEVGRIDYGNFKNSVRDHDLHHAYMDVWTAMSKTQNPPPYSTPYAAVPRHLPAHTESAFADDPGVSWGTVDVDESAFETPTTALATLPPKKRGRPFGSVNNKKRGVRR